MSSISISTSSASGITTTVAVEVWIRPCDSVEGTRWTRCAPLSYFNFEYTLSPVIIMITSLYPPIPVTLASITSVFQPCASAYFWYILKRSPANNAASSPPAAPRISMMIFLSSFGSFGKSKILIFSSKTSFSFFNSDNSSFASSAISSSSFSPSSSSVSVIPCTTSL